MNLFKSELFSSPMLPVSEPVRRYDGRGSAFGRRYGRRDVAMAPGATLLTLSQYGVAQVGDTYVRIEYEQQYDQAA